MMPRHCSPRRKQRPRLQSSPMDLHNCVSALQFVRLPLFRKSHYRSSISRRRLQTHPIDIADSNGLIMMLLPWQQLAPALPTDTSLKTQTDPDASFSLCCWCVLAAELLSTCAQVPMHVFSTERMLIASHRPHLRHSLQLQNVHVLAKRLAICPCYERLHALQQGSFNVTTRMALLHCHVFAGAQRPKSRRRAHCFQCP